MNKTAGIDFGTTNTSIGYSNGMGKSELIPLGYKGNTVDRTSIFYSFDEGGKPITGQKGVEDYLLGDRGRLITSPKRFLKSDELPEIQVLGDKYDLIDIISHIIYDFKKKLENNVGEEIDSILVGRPVKFHDLDKDIDKKAEDRLKEAFKRAGFKNIEFQFEPIGAFNAYSNKHPELKKSNNKVLVVDLGGGTSDFSLFDVNQGGLNILGNTGVYVGGDNLDEKLITSHFSKFLGSSAKQKLINGTEVNIPQHIFKSFSDKSKLLFFKEYESMVKGLLPLLVTNDDRICLSRLNEVFGDLSKGYTFHSLIEEVKIGLTNKEEENISFNMFDNSFETTLSRDRFNELILPDVERIKGALIEILNLSGLKKENIDKVIMNGGTSYIPLVQIMVEDTIGKGKILKENTLSSVGYGLTLESYERFR